MLTAEKKVLRSKDLLERGPDLRNKLEAFELDTLLTAATARIPKYGGAFKDSSTVNNVAGSNKDNSGTMINSRTESKQKEFELDFMAKLEKDLKDDIRMLLVAIHRRDQVQSAARKAFHKLDKECKQAIYFSLMKIFEKEKEGMDSRMGALHKFENTINDMNVDKDISDFIDSHAGEDGSLVLTTRALTLLNDMNPQNIYLSSPSNLSPVNSSETPSSSTKKQYTTVLKGEPLIEEALADSTPKVNSFPSLRRAATISNESMQQLLSSNTVSSGEDSTITTGRISDPWQFKANLSILFYDVNDNNPSASASTSTSVSPIRQVNHSYSVNSISTVESTSAASSTTVVNANSVEVSSFKAKYEGIKTISPQSILRIENNKMIVDAMDWLCEAVKSQKGRELFVGELNQFRSQKVELTKGFDALGVVLWKTLSKCQDDNDVHTAKIIMMLCQTFYRIRPSYAGNPGNSSAIEVLTDDVASNRKMTIDSIYEGEEDEDIPKRGSQFRQYIKEKLMGHEIWADSNYWEQALWQCTMEQVISRFMSFDYLIIKV